VAGACVLVPNVFKDPETVVQIAQKAVDAIKNNPNKHIALRTLGAATYRADRFEDARGYLLDAMESPSKLGGALLGPDLRGADRTLPAHTLGDNPVDCLFLAMTHKLLGHGQEAHHWLDKADVSIHEITQEPPKQVSSRPRLGWRQRLALQVLRREAEGLIGGAGAGRPKAAGAEGAARPGKSP
jgi:hypothetical protein